MAKTAVALFKLKVAKSHGEGTRGGRIIGHTQSGKPVYAGRRRKDNIKGGSEDEYSRQDHLDAADHHSKVAQDYLSRGRRAVRNNLNSDTHFQSASKHNILAHYHRKQSASVEKSGGEGSRGGHIIGHTKTGKAIYAAIPSYPHGQTFHGWSHEDHMDASRAFQGQINERHGDRWDPDVVENQKKAQSLHYRAAMSITRERNSRNLNSAGEKVDKISKVDLERIFKTPKGVARDRIINKIANDLGVTLEEEDYFKTHLRGKGLSTYDKHGMLLLRNRDDF